MGCIADRGGKRRGATLKVRTHGPKSAQNGMARESRLGINPCLLTDRRPAGGRPSRNLKRLPPVALADHAFLVGRRVVKGPLAAGLPGAGIEGGLKSGVAARMSVRPDEIAVGLGRGVGLRAARRTENRTKNRTRQHGGRDDYAFHVLL